MYPTYFSDRSPYYISQGGLAGLPWQRGWQRGVRLSRGLLPRARRRPLHPPPLPASHCRGAALSRKIWAGLVEIEMIDEQGNVLEDPRWV